MASSITPATLPKQFLPFLLGHQECKAPSGVKEKIDQVFARGLRLLNPHEKIMAQGLLGELTLRARDYVYDGGEWVIKDTRTGTGFPKKTLTDMLIHRVNLAEKLRQYVDAHQLSASFVTPQKYLYWNEGLKKFFVIGQKINLADEVAACHPQARPSFIENGKQFGGQMNGLREGKPERVLTPIQARHLAEMSFLGHTDLTYNNLYFDRQGRVALFDTEPHKKRILDSVSSSWIQSLLSNWNALITQQALTGTAKMKTYCTTPELLREVEQVERSHVLWTLAELTTKLMLTLLAIKYAAALVVPYAAIALAFKTAVIFSLSVKAIILALNMISVYHMWSLSHQIDKGFPGLGKIANMELTGNL